MREQQRDPARRTPPPLSSLDLSPPPTYRVRLAVEDRARTRIPGDSAEGGGNTPSSLSTHYGHLLYARHCVKPSTLLLLLLRPHRRQPTRLPCPWDSPSKNTGVGYHFLLQSMKVKSESEVTQSCWTLSNIVRIPDHLTCLLRNLYARQEATVRPGHGTTDWFQIGRGVCQGCILSPCLFNFYAEYIMGNAGLEKAQAGIEISRRNINNLRYADDTTLMAESEEELKSLLMKVKEESEKLA